MLTQAPKGTKDVIPTEVYKWHYVESIIREICACNGYREMRTPTFEHTELFERGVGETTDVVQKEMYTFKDKAGRSITLKPEGTSPIVRAFIENSLFNEQLPSKVYYFTPCLRYEKPQSGRLREHHQFGIEAFGSSDPSIDAEVINVAMSVCKRMGVQDLELRINSIGCPECRREYNQKLKAYLEPKLSKLCDTCKDRYHKNPIRIIDCKEEKCKALITDIPFMLDHLCESCSTHFEKLKKSLHSLELEFVVDPTIVRGLDYYSKTAFEIVTNAIGSQGTVCGGGRYDGLIEECGGPDLPGVGFGMGLERLLLVAENQGLVIPKPDFIDIYIANLGDYSSEQGLIIVNNLRSHGIKADKDYMGRSLKAQMKYANKIGARFVVVLGENELETNQIKVKNMDTGTEDLIKIDELASYLIQREEI